VKCVPHYISTYCVSPTSKMRIVVTNKENGEYCATQAAAGNLAGGGPVADFCSPLFRNSYLRVYALLLGDFGLDEYTQTEGLLILFVIFTLVGMIILLNGLIAVVSDSYEKANMASAHIFGRARILFVAQNQSLEVRQEPVCISRTILRVRKDIRATHSPSSLHPSKAFSTTGYEPHSRNCICK